MWLFSVLGWSRGSSSTSMFLSSLPRFHSVQSGNDEDFLFYVGIRTISTKNHIIVFRVHRKLSISTIWLAEWLLQHFRWLQMPYSRCQLRNDVHNAEIEKVQAEKSRLPSRSTSYQRMLNFSTDVKTHQNGENDGQLLGTGTRCSPTSPPWTAAIAALESSLKGG